jgi:hypothetical protein
MIEKDSIVVFTARSPDRNALVQRLLDEAT